MFTASGFELFRITEVSRFLNRQLAFYDLHHFVHRGVGYRDF